MKRLLCACILFLFLSGCASSKQVMNANIPAHTDIVFKLYGNEKVYGGRFVGTLDLFPDINTQDGHFLIFENETERIYAKTSNIEYMATSKQAEQEVK